MIYLNNYEELAVKVREAIDISSAKQIIEDFCNDLEEKAFISGFHAGDDSYPIENSDEQ